MAKRKRNPEAAEIIPVFGRDEMNMVEFPFGPITANGAKTFEVEHPVFDRALKREVTRKLLITGSDAFGLPRPIDDQVLMGMKAVTYEAKFQSRKVAFSRYHLCKTIGWPIDGRSYRRLEEAFDRIAGTTLKFKDSWWDKGDAEWKSKTFHLIDNVELGSRDRFDRSRKKAGRSSQQLCCFVWNEVIWKSFEDGFIKKVDMEMFRRICRGRKRDVPVRLYRILDKRFYNHPTARFDIAKLCVGTLGVGNSYCPSEMIRILERAAATLIDCGYLRRMRLEHNEKTGVLQAIFLKATSRTVVATKSTEPATQAPGKIVSWFRKQPVQKQTEIETQAIEYCREHNRAVFDGYQRNHPTGGAAFERYREMVVEAYLESRSKSKAA